MMLPKTIGTILRIPTYATELRRWLEWKGFVVAVGSMQNHTMRRDFHAGFFKAPEPKCPRGAMQLIQFP